MGAGPETGRRPLRALLAGGGSGGHVFPALAVGAELARRGWAVDYAGAAGGMEARLVGERGLPFHPLPARPLVGRGLVDRLRALVTLALSALSARRLLRRLGAGVVIGTGGYVSAPALLGAALARRPALLVEPNASAGVANRWLSRWAKEAAVAWESTGAALSCPAVLTGVPVRREFSQLGAWMPQPGPLRLLVLGGSQGSAELNGALPAALAALGDDARGLRVVHQAGDGKAEATRRAYAVAGVDGVEVVGFIREVALAMGEADLVVSRAGAITTAELCAAGRAALLVPLAVEAGGHQVANARALADAGAALWVAGGDGVERRLAAALGDLLAARERLAGMAAAARAQARPDAAAVIADRAERLAGGAVPAERRAA